MEERLSAVSCVICNKPVRLDECKLNDLGEPVHEDCYVERLKEESKRRKAATLFPSFLPSSKQKPN